MGLGHVAITQAILDLKDSLVAGNPFVVLGPVLYDDNYTPAEGTGIIINGVGVGAVGFPVNPGHAYTFSLDINNIFQVFSNENTDGLWYRIWDNVGGVWLSWSRVNDPAIYATIAYVDSTFATIGSVSVIRYFEDLLYAPIDEAGSAALLRVFAYVNGAYHSDSGFWRGIQHPLGSVPYGINYDNGGVTITAGGSSGVDLYVDPMADHLWLIVDAIP